MHQLTPQDLFETKAKSGHTENRKEKIMVLLANVEEVEKKYTQKTIMRKRINLWVGHLIRQESQVKTILGDAVERKVLGTDRN